MCCPFRRPLTEAFAQKPKSRVPLRVRSAEALGRSAGASHADGQRRPFQNLREDLRVPRAFLFQKTGRRRVLDAQMRIGMTTAR